MIARSFELPSPRLVGAGSFFASLCAHLVVVGAGAYIMSAGWKSEATQTADGEPRSEVAVEIAPLELPSMRSGLAVGRSESDPTALRDKVDPGGGEPLARPDMDRPGHGGSLRADSAALNLADQNDGLTLTNENTSRIDRNQIQRLDTARDRASDDNRRATTHPMELVFLASGSGRIAERRPLASANPSRGALRAPLAGVLGGAVGASPVAPGEFEAMRDVGGQIPGTGRASPGTGLLKSAPGNDHRVSAAVAMGRPLVSRAAPSVPAPQVGRARDTVDSEQEVAATVQSLVHASTAGGLLGEGAGGEDGPGPAGSGGSSGPGSRAAPFGGGEGPFAGLSESDPRISAYQRSVRAKIHPLWENAFPKAAALEGKQGSAIVSFVIFIDGQVGEVRVTRPSGIAEFDENVRLAVLRAAPFARFPPNIPGPSMRWSITFDMSNPVVR